MLKFAKLTKMQRYIPKSPIISGILSGFLAIVLQFFCIFCIGLVNFLDYKNAFIDVFLCIFCIFSNLLSFRAIHDLCYGLLGRSIKHNQIYLTICPEYKKLHDDIPILNNIKFIYEYPLSAVGFIETLDDLYPPKNKM